MDLGDRFWSKVAFDTNGAGCWTWFAALKHGYGHYRIDNRSYYSHRLSFEEHRGSVPPGLHLDHLCRNRACCNPAHLEPVTCKVNVQRGTNRNRMKTHCPKGHPLAAGNLYTYSYHGHTYRYCATCCKAAARAAHKRGRK